ncbi:MAG: Hpt domain-containing protein [Bacteroidota bacterium]|uniref:Hpt domain-containing protein n=1 Tax=Pedobacter cryotolerans TaxID=2571270 RepID=A0A4U1CBQ6_9SPHI|nr:Hpt domain-containing protein [Pedobacter cryotolerans]RZJ81624.1 MAG: Hpt domain-containing protein [Flavobacterium sp.]TKC01210.1 Hpt domain-containing protein [Pedobacter cryotolerans]
MINENKNKQPLDLSYLREMSGDSAEFMIEMLDAFQKQTPIYMDDLQNAIKAENWKATSEYAHKMKPTFYYIGREDARDHMQEIERNARELKDIEGIPNAFAEIKNFVPILYQQLEDAKELLNAKL